MGEDFGPGTCFYCETSGWPGPVHIHQRRNDGHQAVQVRTQVPAGATRYWGVIAFHKTGRMSNERLITVFGCVAIFIIAAMVLFATYELTKQYEVEHPAVFEQHQPSDLDQGGNPPSYDRGTKGDAGDAGPAGLPGYPAQRILGR